LNRYLLPLAALLLLAACGETPPPAAPQAKSEPAKTESTADSPKLPDSPATEAAISAEDLAAHIQILASDEFAGRQPGGPGERKTVAYLTREFKRLGLAPGNAGTYVQEVPMIEITWSRPGH